MHGINSILHEYIISSSVNLLRVLLVRLDDVECLPTLYMVCQSKLLTKTSFEKNCFSAWASTLNMGWPTRLIWYVCRLWDMVFS